MKWSREWANANKNTFSMKPLKDLFYKYKHQEKPDLIIDPFARECRLANITNDLNPDFKCDFHIDALKFLKKFESGSVDMILFDPPYSPRQVKEVYEKLNLTVSWESTQATFWKRIKDEITRILKPNGIVITCGWNSTGIGKKNGFVIEEGMNIAHGGQHHDTIIVVDRKVQGNLF